MRREQQTSRETAKLSGRQTITRTVDLYLSNLDDQPARFELQERIPVSEIEQVTIAIKHGDDETSPKASADAHGIVPWQIALAPRATQHVRLVYTISASSDVQGLSE